VSLEDIATIVVTTTGAGVTRAGFGIPLILSYSASWVERTRSYTSISAVGADFPVNSPEYMAANKIFSQSPKVPKIMIGRGALKPTQQFSVGVQAAALNTPYRLRVAVPTGVVWVSQDATYNSGAGATVWSPSNTWARGDLVTNDSAKLYTCIIAGIGGASGPSGTAANILENQVHWMYAGTGNTGAVSNDSVISGLQAKVDALTAPTAVATAVATLLSSSLAGSAGARTLQLTANTSGRFFGLQAYDRNVLNTIQNHADPGVATDLAAVKLESNAWYGLITLFNSEALTDAAAAWVESNSKLYDAASLDTAIPRVAEGPNATDAAHDVKAAAYARSWVFFHPSNDEFADAAEMGKFFPVSPGGETWRMKTLAGVTVQTFTDTEITNMKAKYAHFYYDVGGVSVVGGDGKVGANEYIDVVRFLDSYTVNLQGDLADLVIQNDKIPFTNAGIDLIEAKVTQNNLRGIAAGGISPDPAPTVTAPDVSAISSADKANRELAGVSSTWTLAGAIHHITVNVTAIQ
jgi:Protein of unknown function (DUF3383)